MEVEGQVDGGNAAVGAGAAVTADSPVHVVSWNVAGWIKTMEYIRKKHKSLREWLDRHAIDVLCLQEVKGTSSRLEADSALFDARVEGFDTFWALCDGSASAKGGGAKGFNGVGTLVRRRPGAPPVTANPTALGSIELDSEGRCLVTDHGTLMIFNVYVPNSGSGSSRLPYKLRFLQALRERMIEARAAGKMVVLAGDMNFRARALDTSPSMRIINLDLLRMSKCDTLGNVREILRDVWPKVEASLAEQLTKSVTTTKATGEKVVKFRRLARSVSGRMAALGDLCENELYAKYSYSLGFRLIDDGTSSAVARRRNELCIADFEELVHLVGDVKLESSDATALQKFARPCESPACLDWLHALQLDDGMVDTFAARHPLARRRATCWEQYRARRYENGGTRIDYIFVDEALYDVLPEKNPPLQTGKPKGKDGLPSPVYSAEAALLACTANGLWKPPSFEGGGLIDGPTAAYEHQFYTPHFGMVYTPPQMSDHIGVSAVLPAPTKGPSCDMCTAKTTRSAQPHLAQATIMQSFTLGAAARRKRSSSELQRLQQSSPTPSSSAATAAVSSSVAVAPASAPLPAPLCHQCHFRVCRCASAKGANKKRKKQKGKSGTLNSFVARKNTPSSKS